MFFDPVHANNQLHHKFHSSSGYGSGGHGFCGGGGVSQLYDKNGKRIKGKKKTRSDGELSDSGKE